jgi:hypothetical protein
MFSLLLVPLWMCRVMTFHALSMLARHPVGRVTRIGRIRAVLAHMSTRFAVTGWVQYNGVTIRMQWVYAGPLAVRHSRGRFTAP